MATYTELELVIEELKARTGRASISPGETFELIEKVLEKTKGVDFNSSSMSVRRSYATKAVMTADGVPTDEETGKPLTFGQHVAVTGDPVPANNGIYRYLKPGWEQVYRYGDSLNYIKNSFSSLGISKLYDSVMLMQADNMPVHAITGEPLTVNELVMISNPLDNLDVDNGLIYAWTGNGWRYAGQLGKVANMEFTNNYFDTI